MPDVRDLDEFIDPSELQTGDQLQILNPGIVISAEESTWKKQQIQFKVKLPSGKIKLMSMNKTTRDRCRDAWGPQTEAWVGQSLIAEIEERTIRGEKKRIVFGKPVMPSQGAPPTPQPQSEQAVPRTRAFSDRPPMDMPFKDAVAWVAEHYSLKAEEVEKLVNETITSLGKLISPEGAVQLVAKDLSQREVATES